MNVDDFPWLEDHHRMIRDTVREFASKEVAPGALERDRDKTFPRELFARMAELGLTGVPVPEEWGGAGLDTLAYAITMEEIARADASLALTLAAHTSLGTWPIYAFGDEWQRKRWVPQLASGKELAAFALTLFLFVTRVKRADAQLIEQLAGGEAETAVPSSRSLTWGLVVAGLCLLLGFLVVLLVSLLRASP